MEGTVIVGRLLQQRIGWMVALGAQVAVVLWCANHGHALRPLPSGLLLFAAALFALRQSWVHQPNKTAFLTGAAALAFFSTVAAKKDTYRPEGDEPWYLVQAESIWRDHDLQVTPQEVVDRSAWFYGEPLLSLDRREPQDLGQLVEVNGRMVVEHWPATAAFLVPAVALHSRILGRLMIALLVCLGLGQLVRVLVSLGVGTKAASIGVLALGLTSPLGQYALLFFPDPIAAALLMLSLGVGGDRPSKAAVAGVLSGSTVWLRPALGILSLGVLPLLIPSASESNRSIGKRLIAPFLFGLSAAIGAFLLFQFHTDGRLNPQVMTLAPASAPWFLIRSLFESGRGLAPHYPLWAAAFLGAGASCFARRAPPWATAAFLCCAGYVLVTCLFTESAGVGGWCPPGRFWVPVLPLIAAVAAQSAPKLFLERRGVLISLAVLAGVGLFTNALEDLCPRVAFSAGTYWSSRL